MNKVIFTSAICILFLQKLFCQEFPPPSNFNCGNDFEYVYMTWDYPIDEIVSHYNIYAYGSDPANYFYITSTTELSYNYKIPDFAYQFGVMVTAVYVNPEGESDPMGTIYCVPGMLDTPFILDFENGDHFWHLATDLIQGTINWKLNSNEYFSSIHSAAFKNEFGPTPDSAIANLLSTLIIANNCEQPMLSFWYKTPKYQDKSDTLKFYINTLGLVSEFSNSEDWQYFASEVDTDWETFTVEFMAISGGGAGVFIDDFAIEESGNTEKDLMIKQGIKISPNPISSGKNIAITNIPPNCKKIKIYNSCGQLCKSIPITKAEKISIDVSHLNQGIYMLRFESNGKTYTEKLIIQ